VPLGGWNPVQLQRRYQEAADEQAKDSIQTKRSTPGQVHRPSAGRYGMATALIPVLE
jgi:hypothetical protein